MQMDSPQSGSTRFGISEQYTVLDRLQREGTPIENSVDEFLKSSITQFSAQYDISDTLAVQYVAPVIHRAYRRVEDGSVSSGSESGIGDMTLLFHYLPVRYSDGAATLRMRFFAGVKLPTGDTSRLGEGGHDSPDLGHGGQGHEDHGTDAGHHESGHSLHEMGSSLTNQTNYHDGEAHNGMDEMVLDSGVHSHDLTLGTGSVDFPLGFGITTQLDRFIAMMDVQYMIRNTGAYSYRHANDLIWSSGFGGFVYLEDATQIIARVRLSGQYKSNDRVRGVEHDGSGFNTVFVGPELSVSSNRRFQGVLGLDIPVEHRNTGLQLAPSYRWRGAITYRF